MDNSIKINNTTTQNLALIKENKLLKARLTKAEEAYRFMEAIVAHQEQRLDNAADAYRFMQAIIKDYEQYIRESHEDYQKYCTQEELLYTAQQDILRNYDVTDDTDVDDKPPFDLA